MFSVLVADTIYFVDVMHKKGKYATNILTLSSYVKLRFYPTINPASEIWICM
jgi:hypothetical protein